MHPHDLLCAARLFRRDEVLSRPLPIPKSPGVYAWYFREIPPDVPTDNCVQHDGKTLRRYASSVGKNVRGE